MLTQRSCVNKIKLKSRDETKHSEDEKDHTFMMVFDFELTFRNFPSSNNFHLGA